MTDIHFEANPQIEHFVPPPFWSSFAMRDKLRYLSPGRRPTPSRPPVPLWRQVLSWCYFLIWFLAGPVAIYASSQRGGAHSQVVSLLEATGFLLFALSIMNKAPAITLGQLILCLLTCLAALAFGIVMLWDWPVVIPLVAIFLFLLFIVVVIGRIIWQRQRTTQPV